MNNYVNNIIQGDCLTLMQDIPNKSIDMILCDLLARVLPEYGEIPVGVITSMIGAPLFIFLLKRSRQ